jgi:hypothetical protein
LIVPRVTLLQALIKEIDENELFSLIGQSPSCNPTHFTILPVIMLYYLPFVYLMIDA